MSEAFIIRAGDVVVCVDDLPPVPTHPLIKKVKYRVKRGTYYRVTAVVWLRGEKGVHLESMDHRPTEGWRACRFRKVRKSTGGFEAQLKVQARLVATND